MKESIVATPTCGQACIGEAAQQGAFKEATRAAGHTVTPMSLNRYQFIFQRARDASARYGVREISLLAVEERRLSQ